MKALSLKQPWAELVINGKKTIEMRKWNTKFRGDFLIHASKVPDDAAMKKFGFKELPLGKIIGKAKLIDIKKYESDEDFNKDKSKHLATKEFGNYGFILKDIKKFKKSIPAKGSLNFWNFDQYK